MKTGLIVSLAATAVAAILGVPASTAAGTGPTLTVSFLTTARPTLNHTTLAPIRVQNLGPGRAVHVTLRVSAPAWVTLVRKGCVHRSGALVCTLQPLAAGASVTVRVGVTPLLTGTYSLTARASASAPPPPAAPLQ
jgi:Domain of unknown function DUF11